MSLALAFGITASVITAGKLAWIYRGSAKQVNRTTIDPLPWMIWSVLGVVTLLPQLTRVGWQWTMLFGCANLAINITVVWLARTHDMGRPTKGDLMALGVAGLGITLWVASGDAFYGLWFSLIADFVGVARIWLKAWRDPERELIATWLLGACAAVSALVSAVYSGQTITWWYPAYVVGNALTSAIIIACRRAHLRRRTTERKEGVIPAITTL